MLRELKIENYAIIDTLSIDFGDGLNTITGETGAGKSILLGALGLLSGAKAESAVFADNDKNCVIEALFEASGMDQFFSENDIQFNGTEIIVRRTISPSGRSRAFVNDDPVSLTVLRDLSSRLVDIHSQHQTLLLSDGDYQTSVIDSLSGYSTDRYRGIYRDFRATQRELRTIIEQAANNRQRTEFLEFQISQIEEARIDTAEISQMEQRARMLANATEIAEGLSYATQAMQHDETGVVLTLKNVLNTINRLQNTLPEAEEFCERLNSLHLECKDLASDIESALDGIEINPTELTVIEERLDLVYTLMHKHSVDTPEDLVALCARMQQELGEFIDVDTRVGQLQKLVDNIASDLNAEAQRISLARRKVAPKIERDIVATLRELGIGDARFVIRITDLDDFTATGMNSVEMLFSGNAGKTPQAIESVASGGEMSRVMLAIKGLISQKSDISTIIFDEIDTGVSGVVAHKMGEIIVGMSSSMQVLNITHLPQVASKGERHYLVYKDKKGAHIRRLTVEERIDHIATMLSGSTVTESARRQAIELMKN